MVALLKKYKITLLIFIITFGVYISNTHIDFFKDLENMRYRRMMVSGDIVPNSFLPWLMLRENTISFDPIINTMRKLEGGKERPYFLLNTEKGFKSVYPIIPALMAIPFYAIPVLLQKIPELSYHENILKIFLLGRITASFYAALSVVLFYWILKRVSIERRLNLIFTGFYAFGTLTWSIISRGLWMHTFSQFFFSITLLLLLKSSKTEKLIPWVGFVLGIVVLTKPTNLIFAAIIALYVYVRHKKFFVNFILAALPAILFMAIYNHLTFGNVFSEGYSARNDIAWTTSLRESIPGYLYSPARSFLFISPPLVLAFYAIYKSFKNKGFGKKNNLLYRYLGIGFLLSVVMFAKWWAWDGSNGFGYRMLSDFLPFVGLLSFEIVRKLKKTQLLIIFFLIVYSIYVNGNAVLNRKSRCGRDHNWSFYCLSPPAQPSKY